MKQENIKTNLYDYHVELNAKMSPFGGFLMPISYTNVKSEVLSVREDVGVFDVSHMGEFIVEGIDTNKFIDYILINDFINLPIKKAMYSPLCNKEGYILDDLIVYKLRENYTLICVNASNIKKDWDFINSVLEDSSFDVTITDKTNDYDLVALQGPRSSKVLAELGIISNLEIDELPYYAAIEKSNVEFGELVIARTGYTGEDGFEIFGDTTKVLKLFRELVTKYYVAPCGLASRDVLRIEVCYPLYGHELTEKYRPQDVALSWTLKMDKNDFYAKNSLGEYSPTKRLIKFSLEKGIPRAGYNLVDRDKNTLGIVTSGTMSPTVKLGIGLAIVDKKFFKELVENKKDFFVDIRNKLYKANFSKKAFVVGGHK